MLACCFVDRSHWSSHSPAPRFANGAGSLGNILDALIHHDASSNLAAGLMFMTHDVNVIKDHLVLQETGRFSAEMSSFNSCQLRVVCRVAGCAVPNRDAQC